MTDEPPMQQPGNWTVYEAPRGDWFILTGARAGVDLGSIAELRAVGRAVQDGIERYERQHGKGSEAEPDHG